VNRGIAGLAAPIKGRGNSKVQGSIAVSGPTGRWTQQLMDKFLPDLLQTCEAYGQAS